MAAYEVLLLNTSIPQIQAAQSGDTYVVPRDIAINATAIISANSATDALRITQTGAGNALVVEDSANPDATPFVVTAAGDVGIGTSSPSDLLHLNRSSTNAVIQFITNTGGDARIGVENSTGTGILSGAGAYDTVIRTKSGTGVSFGIGYSAPAMRLDSSGNLGIGTSSPSNLFHLNKSSTTAVIQFITNTGGEASIGVENASGTGILSGAGAYDTVIRTKSGTGISFGVGYSAPAMRLDSTGLGIGTSSPSAKLNVVSASANSTVAKIGGILYSGTQRGLTIKTYQSNGGDDCGVEFNAADGSAGYGSFKFAANTTTLATLDASGNLKLGGTADRATTAGTNHLDIFNGTAPVGTLANGISIYSAAGEAYVMDAAGNATLFSPHDAETNEWIFKSKHTPTGKVLKIDVERLLKFVNDHFGLDAVHEFVEE